MKRIFIASDHAGIDVKNIVSKSLEVLGFDYDDFSPENTGTDDYPDFAFQVSEAVVNKKSFGVLVCGSGIGMSIAANKVKGVRAAFCRSVEDAKFSRAHNDANILVLSSKTSKSLIKSLLEVFLSTEFEKGRHLRRINKIKKLEK
jgi:ribose 5-phosphate isomerase B